jgi:hypothetical protein
VKPFELDFADAKPKDIRVEYSHESPMFAAGIELTWQPPAEALREEALAIARESNVVVAFIGLSPELEGEEMGGFKVQGFAGGDRTDIALPRVQQELLEAMSATGKPLVVVLMTGSAVALNWAQQHANAILAAWYPGESGGTAIAETLAGVNNPAGRLPVTFYASVDLPLLPRRAALRIRLRAQLLHIRLQQSQAFERSNPGWPALERGSGRQEHFAALRERGSTTLCRIPFVGRRRVARAQGI